MISIKKVLSALAEREPKLLWTNPNPTSAFGAQTINLDLSGYDRVKIDPIGISGSSIEYPISQLPATVYLSYINRGASATYVNSRPVDIAIGGITFGNSTETTLNSSFSNYTQNARNIPYKIYGIK